MTQAHSAYPVQFSVDYAGQGRNRLTTFFRIFCAIPIAIILALLINQGIQHANANPGDWDDAVAIGFVFMPLVLMILFRKKYPRWWFDWNLNLSRFMMRFNAYIMLLRDEYPSTDEEQAVHLDIAYPDAKTELMRGMPLVKWFLAIPHIIVLAFLEIGSYFCIFIGWWAILFTGSFPKGFFDYVVGVERWMIRVMAYAILMTTDKYPPFSLEA
jgi:hypothetical protein